VRKPAGCAEREASAASVVCLCQWLKWEGLVEARAADPAVRESLRGGLHLDPGFRELSLRERSMSGVPARV